MLFLFLEYYFNMYAPNLICSYPVSFSDFFPRESSCLVMHMEDNDPVRAYVTIIYYWSMSWWQELFSCLLVLNSLTDFFIKIFCWSVCTGFFCSMSLHNVQIVSSSSWWWTDQFEKPAWRSIDSCLKSDHCICFHFSERGDLIWWIDQGQLFPAEAASQPQSVEYGLRCCCCCLPLCILSFWLWKAQVHQFGIQPVAEADFGWLTRGPQGDHPPVPNPEGCLSHHLRKQMVTVVGDQRGTTSQRSAKVPSL